MAIRDKTTGEGGNRGYLMVRSKISKGPDGYGKVVTQEREAMMEKMGKDPGYNTVAMHNTFGSHFSKKIDAYHSGSRAENTAESNKERARVRKEKLKKKMMK